MKQTRQLFPGLTFLFAGMCLLAADAIAQQTITKSEISRAEYVNNVEVLWNSNPLVSMELEYTSLEDALVELAKQTRVGIYFDSDLVPDKMVSLNINRVPMGEVLDKMLEGTQLEVFTSGRNIVLREKEDVQDVQNEITLHDEMAVIQETVRGQVVDAATGEPLPGTTVIVQGTAIGATTDLDGNFELEVPSFNETLVFTFVGYERLEVPIGGQTEVIVEMESRAILGEEVVVSALGIDRQTRAMGASISRASREDVTVARTPNFADALQGKMAGVNVQQLGTGPQGSTKIRIRGQSSFGGNNSPLIVVNGLPIDNTNFGVQGDVSERGDRRSGDTGDGLSSISPDDIQDITVLKGGAAAALYGSRAKDGVIMITTRQRAEGIGTQAEYTSNFQVSRPIDRRDFQFEFGQGEGGVRPTTPNTGSGVWSFGEKIEPGMTYMVFDGVEIPYEAQRNQLREYYRTGTNVGNNITVSHGGESGGINFSVSDQRSTSILRESRFDRSNVTLGLIQSAIDDRLTVEGNITYSNENRKNPQNVAIQRYSPVTLYTLANTMPMDVLEANALDEDGNEAFWSRFASRSNPYFDFERFENNERDRVFGNLRVNFDFTDWLSLQGRIGQDYWHREQDYNLPHGSQRQGPAPPGFFNGYFVQDQITSREVNADFLARSNLQLTEAISFDGHFGGNLMYRRSERHNTFARDFFVRDIYAIANGRVLTPQFSLQERQVNSLYGSAQFDYRAMVFVTGTLRNDWFSTLSPEERSILYPSVSTSLVFSEIFEPAMPDWLTYGRVFSSYAEVGSDEDVPPFVGALNFFINPIIFQGSPLGGISGNRVPNPGLKPMRVREWEVGVEATIFDNLTFELAFYDKLSKDQILQQQISNVSGFTSQLINIGESYNKGVDAMVDFFPVRTPEFSWNANFNVNYNISKVLDLGTEVGVDEITVGTADFHGELRQTVGRQMNQLYGWGVQRDDQGRTIYDADSGLPLRSETQLNFGSAMPKWVGGFTNTFNYRNLSASFLIDFKLGHKINSATHMNAFRHGLDPATVPGREQGFVVGDGVNPDGSVNTTQVAPQTFYEVIRTHRASEQSIFDASNWQLRSITIGYDLTEQVGTRLGLRGLRLSAVATNVAVLSYDVPHIHPDQNGIMSDRMQGLEATGLPITTNIGFNLNVQI